MSPRIHPKTRSERIIKTVKFFPHNGSIPKISSNEEAIPTARDLIEAIKNKTANKSQATRMSPSPFPRKSQTYLSTRQKEKSTGANPNDAKHPIKNTSHKTTGSTSEGDKRGKDPIFIKRTAAMG